MVFTGRACVYCPLQVDYLEDKYSSAPKLGKVGECPQVGEQLFDAFKELMQTKDGSPEEGENKKKLVRA